MLASVPGKSSETGHNHELLQLSRLILQAPPRRQVRHLNGDSLDFRRANLAAGTRFPCPFSPERLRALYMDEGRTWREIARLTGETAGWENPPHYSVVSHWLREQGLPGARTRFGASLKRAGQ